MMTALISVTKKARPKYSIAITHATAIRRVAMFDPPVAGALLVSFGLLTEVLADTPDPVTPY